MNMTIYASKKEYLFSRIKDCFLIINVAHTKTLVCSFLVDEIGWFKNNRQIYLQYIVLYIYIYIYKCIYIYIYYIQLYVGIHVVIWLYIFSYMHMQIYMYMYLHIYANVPVNVIVKLPHPWSGDSQGQETFLAPSADKQIRNYDKECSNHHLPQSILRSKGLSRSKMEW